MGIGIEWRGSEKRHVDFNGDVNAKVATGNKGREDMVGKEACRKDQSERRHFIDFCAFNNLYIGGSFFQNRKIHEATWSSPDLHTHNQID